MTSEQKETLSPGIFHKATPETTPKTNGLDKAKAQVGEAIEDPSAGQRYRFERLALPIVLRDLYFSARDPGPGDRVPAFDLPTVGGGRFRSSDLAEAGPALLIFGSSTCPVTDNAAPGLNELYLHFGDRVRFVMVNVREAHPGEAFPQPQTTDAKIAHAERLRDIYRFQFEVAVDDLDGTLHRALSPKPNSAYVLGTDGTILFRAQWANETKGLAAALEAIVAGESPRLSQSAGVVTPTLRMLRNIAPVLDRAGRVVGSYRYYGTRTDDPNDIVPHERRRELRGLRVFAAWLNHDDARSLNSLDTYLESGGRHYIRHYLQDFGSTMGSGSTSAQQPRGGYEYLIEGSRIAKGLVTFGLWTPDWTKVEYPGYPSVGNYEADFFQPWKWKTEYPNPAFAQMDAADAFWAARIVSRFTDEMIRALVAEGRLSDPAAAEYLADIMIRRRDKVVAFWISRTNPIDEVAVAPTAGSALELRFDNAAVRLGVARPAARYTIRWAALDNLTGEERGTSATAELSEARAMVPPSAWGPSDDAGARYAVARIHTLHADFPHWAQPVTVTLRDRGGQVDVVGLTRPAAAPVDQP